MKDLKKLHVGPVWKSFVALEQGAELEAARLRDGLGEDDAVRVPDRHQHRLHVARGGVQAHAVGLAVEPRGQVSRAKRRAADVDLADDLGAVLRKDRDVVGRRLRVQLEALACAVVEHCVRGDDAQAVAALLRLGRVRVEDANGHRPWLEGQQAVRTEAAIAVAQHGQQCHDLVERRGHVQHEVVVAERLIFDEVYLRQRPNNRGIRGGVRVLSKMTRHAGSRLACSATGLPPGLLL